jgi:hypothetical protein
MYMNVRKSRPRYRTWLMLATLAALAAGCGGDGKHPILGMNGTTAPAPTAPAVIAVVPANDATGVQINNPLISVSFSEAVEPITGAASLTVTCLAPCTNPTGAVTLNAAGTVATFALTPGTSLLALTQYTGTVTGVAGLVGGLAMTSPFTWQFTTAATIPATADATRPRVLTTAPPTATPGPTPGVASNTSITATFTKDMAPATITAASFTVTCAAPCVSPRRYRLLRARLAHRRVYARRQLEHR